MGDSNGDAAALLALDGVRKSWGERPVLTGIDFELRAGSAVGVVGGNGAGKTTLLRIAAGLISPDGGAVRYRGGDVEADPPAYRQAIGFLSAGDRGLYARLSARQNLAFWAGLAGLSRGRRRHRIGAVLSSLDLADLADRRVDRLSMGQRQRVRLATTFLHEPNILILDEPRTSLDPAGMALLESAVAEQLARGGAVLLASPEPDADLAQQTWLLEEGEIRPRSAPSVPGAGRRTPVRESAAIGLSA